LAPWPALAPTQCSAGTAAASSAALGFAGPSPTARSSLDLIASTWAIARPSSHPRSAGSWPSASSAVTQEAGFDNFAGFPNTHDVGLVILDAPVQTVYPEIDTYASLAAAGTLDAYGTGQDATVTVSGYGVSRINPVKLESFRSRLMATTYVQNLVSHNTAGFNVQIATNPGGGRGGTCFGDSGGPILLDDTDVIAAVNSYVMGVGNTCGGVGFAYRTDQQAVIDWILEHAGSEADEITIVTV
jgi:hypothetical protein